MLRTAKRRGPELQTPKPWSLIIFSVGGKRLAARALEVGGVWPWTEPMPVPSETPYVNAVLRRGEEVLPVYDLAGRLEAQVTAARPLCLIAKRRDGPMAVCIDGDVPLMQTVEASAVHPVSGEAPDVLGRCAIGTEEMLIYSLATLGQSVPADVRVAYLTDMIAPR